VGFYDETYRLICFLGALAEAAPYAAAAHAVALHDTPEWVTHLSWLAEDLTQETIRRLDGLLDAGRVREKRPEHATGSGKEGWAMARQKKHPYVQTAERRRAVVPPSFFRPYPVATEQGQAEGEITANVWHRSAEYVFLCMICERTFREPSGEQLYFSIRKRQKGYIGDVCLLCLLGGPSLAFDRIHARLTQPNPRIPTEREGYRYPPLYFSNLRSLREALAQSRAWWPSPADFAPLMAHARKSLEDTRVWLERVQRQRGQTSDQTASGKEGWAMADHCHHIAAPYATEAKGYLTVYGDTRVLIDYTAALFAALARAQPD
jgi:hypothetical protein